MENQGSSSGESAEQEGRQGHTEGAAPKEKVQCMYASIRGLVDQGGAAESPPCQHLECCPSFIAPHEVTGENACFQFLALPDSIAYFSVNSFGAGFIPVVARFGLVDEITKVAKEEPGNTAPRPKTFGTAVLTA
jgi:hypothetical protein